MPMVMGQSYHVGAERARCHATNHHNNKQMCQESPESTMAIAAVMGDMLHVGAEQELFHQEDRNKETHQNSPESTVQAVDGLFSLLPPEILSLHVLPKVPGAKVAVVLSSAKAWQTDLDMPVLWKKVFQNSCWEIDVGEKPAKRSWQKHFMTMFCEQNNLCLHCLQKGKGGHRSVAIRGVRPLCSWLASG